MDQDSLLSNHNIRPDNSNPHDVEAEERQEAELSPEVLEEVNDIQEERTSEFRQEPSEEYAMINAAYVSQELTGHFEENGEYLAAIVGPNGVQPVIVANEDNFFIDAYWDPDEIPEDCSPLEILDQNGYPEELTGSIQEFQITNLAYGADLEIVRNNWDREDCDLKETGRKYLVAPGLEEEYREALDQME